MTTTAKGKNMHNIDNTYYAEAYLEAWKMPIMELFGDNGERFLAVCYFHTKAPP